MMETSRNCESESRNRILQAAYPLFVEHGYNAVSMQQVADAVSVNKATLYHHFRNKDAMFLAVVQVALRRTHENVAAIVREGGPAQEQMVRVATMMFQSHQSDLGRLMTDLYENLPAEARLSMMKESAPWDLYDQVFTSAVQSGELPALDVAMATNMFIGLVHGQAWARKVGRIASPPGEAEARILIDVLFAGLRDSPLIAPPSNGA
jgi:AcrR family transcriptional regulator